MKAIGRLAILVLAPSAFLIAATTGCGGKTAGNFTTNSTGGSGGNASLGGNVSVGGSVNFGGNVSVGGSVNFGGSVSVGGNAGTSVVAPRAPAVHRVQALSCVGVYSPPEPPSTVDATYGTCTKHADCTEGVNGKCAASGVGYAGRYYYCNYDLCATDADCDTGTICYCTASAAARCLTVGNCLTDADCSGGSYGYCSPSMGFDCDGYHSIDAFHCHTASDTCMDDADCAGTDYCDFDIYEGSWKCTATNDMCAIG